MTFYLISKPRHEGSPSPVPPAICNACEARGIPFQNIDVTESDLFNLPLLVPGDIVYRSGRSKKARVAEKLLLTPHCGHVYKDLMRSLDKHDGSYFHHIKHTLPVIPTIPFIPDATVGVDTIVDRLGGTMPVVIKIVGGTDGKGVIRVDSKESLRSLLDYFRGSGIYGYIRKYIPHNYYSRVVVLNGQVIASHITYVEVGEFRANAWTNDDLVRHKVITLDEAVQNIAVHAVTSLGFEFGGVDILFDELKNPYIAEVNMPFDFMHSQDITKVDIAGALVDFLMEKARRNQHY